MHVAVLLNYTFMPLMHGKDSFSNFVQFEGEGIDTNFDDKILYEHVTDNGKECMIRNAGMITLVRESEV